MESLHILPYPPSVLQESTGEEGEFSDQEHIQYWRAVLDKLANGEISWDLFLDNYDGPLLSHPAAWLTTSQDSQSLLHLAVIYNRREVVQQLSESFQLKTKKNRFGQTALETAQFLYRTQLLAYLAPAPTPSFWEQPNVAFPDLEKSRSMPELEYLPYPIFENPHILREILFRSEKAKQEDEIPTEKIWMGIYFEAEIQKQQNPAIAIRFIDEEVGFGAFAAQRIPACSFVGEYTGVVEERKTRQLKDKFYCVRYPTWQMGKRKFVINAEQRGNFTRYINHSDSPNLTLQSVYWRGMLRMIFVATQEIPEGTQFTFNYGNIFWKECSQIPRHFE